MAKSITKFKVGDIVQLKSGGPKMTIDEVFDRDDIVQKRASYRCKWFNGKKVEVEIFADETLMSPENDKKEE